MAVPNVPFWLSQANTEFQANGWASNIMGKPVWLFPGGVVSWLVGPVLSRLLLYNPLSLETIHRQGRCLAIMHQPVRQSTLI